MTKLPFEASDNSRSPVHLALPLGVLGFAGASFVSDYFRFGFTGQNETARGAFTLMMPLCAALFGLALSSRTIARSRPFTWLTVVFGTIAVGMMIAATVGSFVWGRGELGQVTGEGAASALVFLPFVALVTWAARIAGRARRGSLVDDSDRRAPWTLIAAAVAIGRLVISGSPPQGLLYDRAQRLPSVCSALALLACIALLGFVVIDLVSLSRARRAQMASLDMSARDPSSSAPCDETLDLGVGEEEYEELFGGPAYRTAVTPLRVIRGSPDRAIRHLRRAALASLASCVVAWSVTLAAMLVQ